MLAEDGGPNAMFFTVLSCDEPMALEFLKDIGLLQSKHLSCDSFISVRKRIGISAMCHDDPRVASASLSSGTAVYSDHIRLRLVWFCC